MFISQKNKGKIHCEIQCIYKQRPKQFYKNIIQNRFVDVIFQAQLCNLIGNQIISPSFSSHRNKLIKTTKTLCCFRDCFTHKTWPINSAINKITTNGNQKLMTQPTRANLSNLRDDFCNHVGTNDISPASTAISLHTRKPPTLQGPAPPYPCREI